MVISCQRNVTVRFSDATMRINDEAPISTTNPTLLTLKQTPTYDYDTYVANRRAGGDSSIPNEAYWVEWQSTAYDFPNESKPEHALKN